LVGGLVGAWVFADIIIFMLGGHLIIPFPPHIILIMRPRDDAPSLAAERDGAAAAARKRSREQAIFIVLDGALVCFLLLRWVWVWVWVWVCGCGCVRVGWSVRRICLWQQAPPAPPDQILVRRTLFQNYDQLSVR
jgi:hypothetical protein